MNYNFDVEAIIELIKKIFFIAVKIPVTGWRILPQPVKMAIIGLVMILTLSMFVWLLRNKDAWKFVRY